MCTFTLLMLDTVYNCEKSIGPGKFRTALGKFRAKKIMSTARKFRVGFFSMKTRLEWKFYA